MSDKIKEMLKEDNGLHLDCMIGSPNGKSAKVDLSFTEVNDEMVDALADNMYWIAGELAKIVARLVQNIKLTELI